MVDVKLVTLQKSLVKVVAGALHISTEVQKKLHLKAIAQMVADVMSVAGKMSYDFQLKAR